MSQCVTSDSSYGPLIDLILSGQKKISETLPRPDAADGQLSSGHDQGGLTKQLESLSGHVKQQALKNDKYM